MSRQQKHANSKSQLSMALQTVLQLLQQMLRKNYYAMKLIKPWTFTWLNCALNFNFFRVIALIRNWKHRSVSVATTSGYCSRSWSSFRRDFGHTLADFYRFDYSLSIYTIVWLVHGLHWSLSITRRLCLETNIYLFSILFWVKFT